MEIIHVSAECYPMAKAGGLGDVVGALPKYQCKLGHFSKVVMPMYRTRFLYQNEWVTDFKGRAQMGNWWFDYTVIREKHDKLGFPLYVVDINGLLDRDRIYGYADDTERFTAFQIAVVDWINHWQHKPDVIHCHDYHAGLIPFILKNSYYYNRLADIPTVMTIHNAQYQGWMGWDKGNLLPVWDITKGGLLEWGGVINPLAAGIKNAWKVTTVSWSYLEELRYNSNGLEALFEYEKGKCVGVLNGIDNEVWDPMNDPFIEVQYDIDDVEEGKRDNKTRICREFGLDPQYPLIAFIGRLVGEKAADILPDAIVSSLYGLEGKVNFLVLGSGEPHIEWQLSQMKPHFPGNYNVEIGYNEALSHQLYAGADFLLMPSRVEPCGLNQMYSMRYGTVPMVRSTGGLKDTVTDMGDEGGWGIRFNNATVGDVVYSVNRALELFGNTERLNNMRRHMMQIDHSWEHSVQQYIDIYQRLKY
ncbi:glycogen synthase [Filimonas effusa]|uniref:Glycogen synthase n=1 Tax=Filimonas effusa TaxID=2508721 RepID=A0A4Q1DAR0_9BACT|nr:glycogen synthase [Filimonas effusa]RXK85569.1 glycogen synthase [Filimonas effusa]